MGKNEIVQKTRPFIEQYKEWKLKELTNIITYTNAMLKKIKLFLFENQTVKQTVLKNTFWLGFGNIAGRLIRAVVIIYTARKLGAADYGIFSYALSLAAFFTLFSDIGVNAILTKEGAKKPLLRYEYFSTIFFIKIVLLIISLLLIFLLAPIFTKIPEALPLIPIIAFILIFDAIREFSSAYTRALEKMELEAGVFIFTNIAVVIFSLAALIIKPTIFTLTIGYAAGSALGALAMVLVLRKEYKNVFGYFNKKLIYPIISAAWPFAFLGLLGGIMINMDMIMLGWMRTAQELGFYAAAQKPVLLLYLVPSIIATSIFPVFSRFSAKDTTALFRSIIEKVITLIIAVALPLIFGGIILSQEIIQIIYGNEYLPSIPAFQILILTILFIYPGTIIGNAIFAYDKQKSFLGAVFAGAVGNFFLNMLLIPYYGITGAALATIAAQILNNGILWRSMKKINNFKTLTNLKKVIPAAVFMAFFTLTLKWLELNFFLNVILSAALYISALYAMKEKLLLEIIRLKHRL